MVDLSYYNGRAFESLDEGKDGEWSITLDGDAKVTNKDAEKPLPDAEALAGTSFIRPVFSELDTRMQFGVLDVVQLEVILTPALYTISDPVYAAGEGEIYPQVPVPIEDELPEDPSDERVADGPEAQAEEGE